MAEYIDRDDVRFHCSCDYCSNGDVCNFCESNVIEYSDFMEIPNADVVEREKVKSLIEVAIEDGWELDYTLERLKEI